MTWDISEDYLPFGRRWTWQKHVFFLLLAYHCFRCQKFWRRISPWWILSQWNSICLEISVLEPLGAAAPLVPGCGGWDGRDGPWKMLGSLICRCELCPNTPANDLYVLGSKPPLFSYGRDGHQPFCRILYTNYIQYKDSLFKVGWLSPIYRVWTPAHIHFLLVWYRCSSPSWGG